jgi:hypothetical protein
MSAQLSPQQVITLANPADYVNEKLVYGEAFGYGFGMAPNAALAALVWKDFAERKGVFAPLLEPLFKRSTAYTWHEPTVHPKGYFILRPDPYAWYDPLEGQTHLIQPAQPTGWTIRRSVVFAEPLTP